MYDLLVEPVMAYLRRLAPRLPWKIQVHLLRQVLPLVETYGRKTPEDEALLRGARAYLKSLECDSSSAPDPKAHSSPPDKQPPAEDKSEYPGRDYSVTMKIPGGPSREGAVRLALAMGADHILFQDPIPVAWLRREDDTKAVLDSHPEVDPKWSSVIACLRKGKPPGAK